MKIERYEVDGVRGFKVRHDARGRKLFVCVARESGPTTPRGSYGRLGDADRLRKARKALLESVNHLGPAGRTSRMSRG